MYVSLLVSVVDSSVAVVDVSDVGADVEVGDSEELEDTKGAGAELEGDDEPVILFTHDPMPQRMSAATTMRRMHPLRVSFLPGCLPPPAVPDPPTAREAPPPPAPTFGPVPRPTSPGMRPLPLGPVAEFNTFVSYRPVPGARTVRVTRPFGLRLTRTGPAPALTPMPLLLAVIRNGPTFFDRRKCVATAALSLEVS